MVRIRERDLIIPALEAAAARPDGKITTSDLIVELTNIFQPEGQDSEILDGRRDTYFSQKVRNLISHKNSSTSMFAKGYAEHIPEEEAIRITDAGRAFLNQVPDE
ncbi:MAG: hypothetical protein ACFBWO_07700 [Paracoccaceae bacterium]